MTEKLKSGVAHKSIVETVNALIDRIDALEAEAPAEEQAAPRKAVRKPKSEPAPSAELSEAKLPAE
ncbi:hypothetical protein PBI_MRMAGOO_113 [Mycobacterium phage MrMagoo]|uniref:Uncharacterized protein n=1 Tax=Mycobacterium phage MrMagoo TaxID=1927020 RepID=A0A1L6BYN6_9CAUD|nr:hypothetical protein J4U04_gp154 [Mycobacterium phage MrMagoo]APQ42208.1 hypothetical protein PBI_MRMAGOO_113 [Mycobacterium phage MrMagoo]